MSDPVIIGMDSILSTLVANWSKCMGTEQTHLKWKNLLPLIAFPSKKTLFQSLTTRFRFAHFYSPHKIPIRPIKFSNGIRYPNKSDLLEEKVERFPLTRCEWFQDFNPVLAGVQCAGNPHFWVNEDGSYQEEGQKNTKGYIWGKAGNKLLSAVLSLPVQSKSTANASGELAYSANSRSILDHLEHRTLQKILLVGNRGSGTSTLFKQ